MDHGMSRVSPEVTPVVDHVQEAQVVVQVMCVCYQEPGGEPVWERMSIAAGELQQALEQALRERLIGWACEQVYEQILARPPVAGEHVEYEALFSPFRHLIVTVEHTNPAESEDGQERHVRVPIAGLRIPQRSLQAQSDGGASARTC